MKWRKNIIENGTRRVISFFAWFPIELKGEIRWLETVRVEQCYFSYAASPIPFWSNLWFVD